MSKLIYLDNAATTYPKPEIVYDRVNDFLRKECVNAGRGSYKLANKANDLINETKGLILELINGSNEDRVIFSPSATIALNQVLRGLDWDNIKNVYVTPFEHNAIMRTLKSLNRNKSLNINIIPFDNITFELDQEKLNIMFSKDKPDLILMSQVSNVTGFILPIEECANLAKHYNPIVVVDCSQSLGVNEVNIKENFSEVDFIIFAGHKSLYSIFGIAGFISVGNKIKLNEVITGGTGSDSTNLDMPLEEEKGYEAGSYNMQAIAGLNSSLKWIKEIGREQIYNHKKELTKELIDGLADIDGIELYIPENLEKHIGIVSFNLEGFRASEVGQILGDEFNIAVRTGHHCAALIGGFLDGYAVEGTVRASLGYFNEKQDIEILIDSIKDIIGG